jgi:hypothetical protein
MGFRVPIGRADPLYWPARTPKTPAPKAGIDTDPQAVTVDWKDGADMVVLEVTPEGKRSTEDFGKHIIQFIHVLTGIT